MPVHFRVDNDRNKKIFVKFSGFCSLSLPALVHLQKESCRIVDYLILYNKLSYARILIGSHL